MDELPKTFLNPCQVFARREPHLVTTLLGSCVAVCLWDSVQGFGGMNHYMLPLWNGEGLPTPRYGNVAIETLLKRLLELGCRKEHLVAKVFGGAGVLAEQQAHYRVGERNILIARETLASHGLAIAAEKVGGSVGMKVLFNTATGVALLMPLTGQPVPRIPTPAQPGPGGAR